MSELPATFGNKYRPLRRLAQGGMGEVFLAVQEGPGGFSRQVVVKTLLPDFASSAAIVQMFQQEARLAALLTHPNIVHLNDFGEQAGAYYIVMEYLEGEALTSLLRAAVSQGRTLSPGLVAAIGSQVCAGLAYAWTRPGPDGRPLCMVHRDVSPHNIVICTDGIAKLLDFGIAKFEGASNHTEPGAVKGKPAYLSPEQCNGAAVDARSDVFSLGIVLWESCALRRLYQGNSVIEIANRILTVPAPELGSLGVAVPAELAAIIDRALEIDPARRFQSAAEMGRALDAFLLRSGCVASDELRAALPQASPASGPGWVGGSIDPFAAATGLGSPSPSLLAVSVPVLASSPSPAAPPPLAPASFALPAPAPAAPLLDLSRIPIPSGFPSAQGSGEFVIEPVAAQESPGMGLPWERTVPLASGPAPTLELAPTALAAPQGEPTPAAPPDPSRAPDPAPFRPPPQLKSSSGPSAGVLVLGGLLLLALAAAGYLVVSRSNRPPEPPPPDRPSIAEGLASVAFEVSSEPAGARVFLDGQDTGKQTPVSLTVATGKEHTYELRHPDCLAHSSTAFAFPNQPGKVEAKLKRGARVEVTTDPAGATVRVDGQESFTTPGRSAALAPGKHQLLAQLAGRASESREVEVKADEALDWTVKLDPALEVQVVSLPPGAEVLVDGKPTGVQTPGSVWVRAGKRRQVKVRLPGYVPVTRRLDLVEGRAPPTVEVLLEDSKAADLKGRIAALGKRVAADERRLQKLQKMQSGVVVADPKKELKLEKDIAELERTLEEVHGEIGALREELEQLESKALDPGAP